MLTGGIPDHPCLAGAAAALVVRAAGDTTRSWQPAQVTALSGRALGGHRPVGPDNGDLFSVGHRHTFEVGVAHKQLRCGKRHTLPEGCAEGLDRNGNLLRLTRAVDVADEPASVGDPTPSALGDADEEIGKLAVGETGDGNGDQQPRAAGGQVCRGLD
jgi:hypothetical protein